ncbi:MAG TPA: homoserine dehydrogenase [Blastocatellia bacterium]|nr:homoserine dehydrogenase [Blastocatellia bacterium]
MELRLAFIGFGNVARSFARILTTRARELFDEYGLRFKTIAIATGSHGCVTSNDEIDLIEAVKCVERGDPLTYLSGCESADNSVAVLNQTSADVMFETTPLDINSGEPAIAHIRTALARGIHVVTANKGPIAFGYSELKSLAVRHNVQFRFEGTVMDGTPIFNLVELCLPGARVLGFSGVLNSTTNLILTGMQAGQSFEETLAEAQRRGIAEANADFDIDGWDAAVKAVALANVLMNAEAPPADVKRKGIRDISINDVEAAAASGNVIRLVARAEQTTNEIGLVVRPELVPRASVFGSLVGTSNALVIKTDLMGETAVIENDPGVEQTAYALLSDLISVHKASHHA